MCCTFGISNNQINITTNGIRRATDIGRIVIGHTIRRIYGKCNHSINHTCIGCSS